MPLDEWERDRIMMPAFTVAARDGVYPVDFFASIAETRATIGAYDRPFFLIDDRVNELHGAALRALTGDAPRFSFIADEHEKTLAGVERVVHAMQAAEMSRAGTLIVIGGGIVQDVGAFAAAIYRRGVPYVLVPTTLLSMADSGIGSKYGVNLGSAKNQLGGFRAPARVVISTEFLTTLTDAEMRSGFGEIIKLAIIDGAEAFERVRTALLTDGVRTGEMLALLSAALQTKKRYIEADEFDEGIRKTLNYGHTFGHALEGLIDHEVPHGEAVAWGLDLANRVAVARGLLDESTFERVHGLVDRIFTRRVVRDYDAAGLVDRIRLDKKSAAGSVDLILPAAAGDVRIVRTPIDARLTDDIASYLREYDVFRRAVPID
jgi:3-dehydroquinate synthase